MPWPLLKPVLAGPAWLLRRPGYLLLAADEAALARQDPARFERAWVSLIGISLVWGVFVAWWWATAGMVFSRYLMHTALVVAVTTLWLFRESLLALCRCLGGDDGERRHLICTVLVVALALMLQGLRKPEDPTQPPLEWLSAFPAALRVRLEGLWRGVFPEVVLRVLMLAPLWGAWAMLITCQFCKPSARTEPAVAALARGCGAAAGTLTMALPLGGTLLYLYFLDWWRLLVAGLTILTAILAGLLLCRRAGGLTRRALLAVNFLTQLAFLITYLASRGLASR